MYNAFIIMQVALNVPSHNYCFALVNRLQITFEISGSVFNSLYWDVLSESFGRSMGSSILAVYFVPIYIHSVASSWWEINLYNSI